jgi:plastocyanin
MSGRLAMLAGCAAIVAFAGCGSSSTSSSSSSASTKSTATTTGTSATGGFKVTTTPKFAPASGPVRSGTVQIAYRNVTIAPGAPRVKVGSTIKWTNFDDIAHNVTSEDGPQKFASKDFGEGGTFEIKARKPGVIHYECTIHPATMNGTIEVVS